MGNEAMGVHNALIKTPLDDVLRALPENVKTAIAAWYKGKGPEKVRDSLYVLHHYIYAPAKLSSHKYMRAMPM
jgi:hypothetical protein